MTTLNPTNGLPPNIDGMANGVAWMNAKGAWLPTVVVTPGGGPGGDGGDYGSQTPGTQTNGIQEAINYISQQGGGTVWLNPTGVFNYSAQIIIPPYVSIQSDMRAGESQPAGTGYPVLVLGKSYLNFTGPSTVQDTILIKKACMVSLKGIVAVANVPGLRSVFRITSSSGVTEYNCAWITNQPNVIAKLVDGAFSTYSEANADYSCFLSGAPALQIGLADEHNHANDSVHYSLMAEGPWNGTTFQTPANTAVVNIVLGSNHTFVNFYSRGDTWTNPGAYQFIIAAGAVVMIGGEQYAVHAEAGLWSLVGGRIFVLPGTSVNVGTINIAGGILIFSGVAAGFPVNQLVVKLSRGSFAYDEFSMLGQMALIQSGGNFFPPAQAPFSAGPAGGLGAYTATGGNRRPL
jgi:hypothetical protein